MQGVNTYRPPYSRAEDRVRKSIRSEREVASKFNTQGPIAGYVIITVACMLSYSNGLTGDLVHDDVFAIKSNPDVKGERPWMKIFQNDFWGKPMTDHTSHKSYRPVCMVTFRLNFLLHGLQSYGYHLVNIGLHTTVCFVFWKLCTEEIFMHWHAGVLSSILFAVHPVHTEAVTGIVGRADVLACLFFLLSLLCFLRASKRKKVNNMQVSHKHLWLLGFCAFGILATFTKETGITVFGVCAVYDLYLSRDHLLRVMRKGLVLTDELSSLMFRLICTSAMVVAILAVRISMLHGQLPQFTPEDNPASFSDSLQTKVLTYSYLAAFNLRLLLAPLTLSYDWQVGSIPLIESLWDLRNFETLLAGTTLAVVCYQGFKSKQVNYVQKPMIWGLILLVIPFLPASNIFLTVGFVVAERILYIPSLGYCILITHGLILLLRLISWQNADPSLNDSNNNLRNDSISSNTVVNEVQMDDEDEALLHAISVKLPMQKFVATFFGFFLLLLATRTYRRNEVWQTRERLFRSGVEILPHNAKAHYNYGNFLKDNQRNEEASAHYQKAISLYPEYASAHNNLATILEDDKVAIKHLMLALKYEPQHYRALFNLAGVYRRQQEMSKAKELLEQCLRLSPSYTDARMAYAEVLQSTKSFAHAEAMLRDAIAENPSNPDIYNNLGVLFGDQGRNTESIKAYKDALRLKRNHSIALLNMGRQYKSMGLKKEAESALRRSIAIEPSTASYEALGVLLYQESRFQESRDIFADAIKQDPEKSGLVKNYALALEACGEGIQALQILEQHCVGVVCPLEVVYLRLNLLTNVKNFIKVLETADKGLQDYPSDVELHLAKGHALRELKNMDDAIVSYKAAIHINATHFRAHSSLGAVYHIQRKYDLALEHYNKALAVRPDDELLNDNLAKLRRLMGRKPREA